MGVAASALCRDCLREALADARRCSYCGSPRLLRHAELHHLSIAHIDCDAFYASVEKRDHPELSDKAVIIGGGKRGVVSTCCYVARLSGVRSAMPMFKARALCPEAVIIPPDMAKYKRVGGEIRTMMRELSPLVEPLSIDEAFLDLSGTERMHHASPALVLARFARRVEQEVGVTVSVGLSFNKFLAKIASELDKPRGFAVIGKAEARAFLADKPVSFIWGVGKVTQDKLQAEGFRTLGDLRRLPPEDLFRRFGAMGSRLSRLAWGDDDRKVEPFSEMKSVSTETTYDDDISDARLLDKELWRLCEKLSARLKADALCGRTVTLKLKTKAFKLLTRSRTLTSPTALAQRLYDNAQELLSRETNGTAFRLMGIGVSDLHPLIEADPPDLADPDRPRLARREKAMDQLREKFGQNAIVKGLALKD